MDQRPDLFNQSLYEIPACSICLCQMTQDLASLGCGHVFHIYCITQHFGFKGTCPNCQKRAQIKQIRLVVFPVQKHTKTNAYLQALLSNIQKSQGQQVEGLLLEIKSLSEKLQKHEYQYKQSEKQLRKKRQETQNFKRELESKTVQYHKIQKQNKMLLQQNEKINLQMQRINIDMLELRFKYDEMLSQKKQLDNYKAIKYAAQDCSKQLIKFKSQLQNKQTPPQIMAKTFLEMLQLKNLHELRSKQKKIELIEKIKYKEEENIKLRNQIQIIRKQSQSKDQQINKWKAKYEKLKDKYKQLAQKLRSKTQQNLQAPNEIQENSLSLSLGLGNKLPLKLNTTISLQKNERNERQVTFNFVDKQKNTQITKISFGGNAIKRPVTQQKKQISLKNFMNS